jgi:mRNA interferase MazF
MPSATQASRSATSSANAPYCPGANEFIWISFSPQAGSEQAGKRPALVLSPRAYNEKSRLCVVVPITNQDKGYPFEVALPGNCGVSGVALADQVRSLSWEARHASFISAASEPFTQHVRAKIKASLGIP